VYILKERDDTYDLGITLLMNIIIYGTYHMPKNIRSNYKNLLKLTF